MSDPFFQPLDLGTVTLPNRLVMSPMTRGGSPDGLVPEGRPAYYGERAEHGIGLIVTEGIAVDHPAAIGDAGSGVEQVPVLAGEGAQAGWQAVVDRVHRAGSLIFPQLWHQGGVRLEGTGRHPDAPSPRPSGIWGPEEPGPFFKEEYRARRQPQTRSVREEEIADLIAAFARTAADAVAVGFDGIAIHGAHGYLIDSFLWHGTNLRTDSWGGDLRGRTRFAVEVVRAIRAVAGDRPIMFRFSQWKIHDWNARLVNTPAELETLLAPLVDAGVTLFDASTRRFAVPAFEGSPLGLAAWAQKLTGRPTMAVGGLGLSTDLQSWRSEGAEVEDNLPLARSMIERDEIALVGIGRGLLMNVDWAERVRTGQPLEIMPPADATRL